MNQPVIIKEMLIKAVGFNEKRMVFCGFEDVDYSKSISIGVDIDGVRNKIPFVGYLNKKDIPDNHTTVNGYYIIKDEATIKDILTKLIQ